MHRTNRVPQTLRGLLLVSLVLAGAAAADAQAPVETAPPPKPAGTDAGPLVVLVNGVRGLQMRNKQAIAQAHNERDTVAALEQQPGDPTTVLVKGLTPGRTRVTLTGVDKTVETFEIMVQAFDVDFLKSLLERAVPTANVVPIPGVGGTIILTGTVARPEDVDVVLRIAESVVSARQAAGTAVINALQVGGVMQVQLDVVVARVQRTEFRRMSFDFLNDGSNHILTGNINALTVPQGGITGTFPGGPTILNQWTPTTPSFFLGIFNNQQDFFGLLQALKEEGVAKILTQPKVTTLSGRPAYLLSGGTIPFPQQGGLGTTSIAFRPFGTEVNVLPIVLGNGKIHLEVEPRVSRRNDTNGVVIQGALIPGFDENQVRVAVQIESGQTLAIGGLIENVSNTIIRKVPVLGELPFIGAAFRTSESREEEVELVVIVTPYLVDPMDCAQLPKRLPGQETRSPDDFELFLEGIAEAPRGPRNLCQHHCYVPAYKNDPTLAEFPCAGKPIRPGPGCVRSPNHPAAIGLPCGAAGCGAAGCVPAGCVGCGPAGCPNGAGGPGGSCPGGACGPQEAATPPPTGSSASPAPQAMPAALPAAGTGAEPVLPPLGGGLQ